MSQGKDNGEAPSVDFDIEALIDGELAVEDAEKLMARIKDNTGLQERYKMLKNQKSWLQKWWAQSGNEQ